jgi:hypothetical protein
MGRIARIGRLLMILPRAAVAPLDVEGRNDGAIKAASFESMTHTSRLSRSREVIEDSWMRKQRIYCSFDLDQCAKDRKQVAKECLHAVKLARSVSDG